MAKPTLKIVIAVLALALVGCSAKSVETSDTNNAEIRVDRLFDHDGCTVYRFMDFGAPRYFAKCRDGSSRTEWSESVPCGKTTCIRPHAIQTNLVKP